MKSAKTILAVALLIVGFAYVTHAYPPTFGTADQCCGPLPEDFRSYFFNGTGPIIASVEGENGMIITDVVCRTNIGTNNQSCFLNVDGETLLYTTLSGPNGEFTRSVHFQSGLPVPAGAEITSGGSNMIVTISGYVY